MLFLHLGGESLLARSPVITDSLVYGIQIGPKKEKNTPIIRKDENSLKLKLIITTFNIHLLTLRKSVAS